MNQPLLLTVGVVSDTHIPDRVDRLHPQVIPILRAAHVDQILHAGDISIPPVLDELRQVAPVTAVCGNRDLVFGWSLPQVRLLDLAGVKVALLHGHGGWIKYIQEKFITHDKPYVFERFYPILLKSAPDARVYVFGHSHYPENFWQEGKLLFNPGSASSSLNHKLAPSVGILRFYGGGQVEGEIIKMYSHRIAFHQWVEAGTNLKDT